MPLNYCIQQVRQYDYETSVLLLFAPAKQRPGLWAIHAFCVELSRVRDLIREPMMGLIRFQWWKDSIDKLYSGEVLRHEVLQALAKVIPQYDLKQEHFNLLIDAYQADLELVSYDSFDQLISVARDKTFPLLNMEKIIAEDDISIINLESLGIADSISKQMITDYRYKPYKEAIKIQISSLIKQIDLKKKNSVFSLRKSLIKRRLKAIENNTLLQNGTLAFHLWVRSF